MRKLRVTLLALLMTAGLLVGLPATAPAQGGTTVDWTDWTFDYAVNGNFEGISLNNVTFQGRKVLEKASFPVMTVFYENNACGPYADRLGGTTAPVEWANNARIVLREFTVAGERWFEVGIKDFIGQYEIYQAWYLQEDGILDGHVFAKGLQCNIDHEHYPFWRLDVDLDGASNDQMRRMVNGAWQTLGTEFDRNATEATNHMWQVRDTQTDMALDIDFAPTGFTNVPPPIDPEDNYIRNTVAGRRFQSAEDNGWSSGAQNVIPGSNGENINGQDLVVFYSGYLPHLNEEGPVLWHSTGVRLTVDLNDDPPPPPAGGVGEAGKVSTFTRDANSWRSVNFERSYDDPIVVMGPASRNGSDPLAVRVRNVTSTGFQFQLDEWAYLDNYHSTETIGWVVMERGTHTLDDGRNVVAGKATVGEDFERQQLPWPLIFDDPPTAISQVVTNNDPVAVTTRHSGVYRSSFKVKLQDEEANRDRTHGDETVHWMVFERGASADGAANRTGNSVTDQWRSIGFGRSFANPVVLAQAQGYDGSDPITSRYRNLTGGSVQIKLDEEKSRDSEVAHTTEIVGWVVIGQPGLF